MILAIDVQYIGNNAFVAGVEFDDWRNKFSTNEYTSYTKEVADYEPGKFYKRELPCILKLLNEHNLKPRTIVVDGYVYLDGKTKPGLGKYLFDVIDSEIVGVAKKSFSGIGESNEIFRGGSQKALYVTTSGDLEEAKNNVASMYGKHRIPTLLKRADQLCREEANKSLQRNADASVE